MLGASHGFDPSGKTTGFASLDGQVARSSSIRLTDTTDYLRAGRGPEDDRRRHPHALPRRPRRRHLPEAPRGIGRSASIRRRTSSARSSASTRRCLGALGGCSFAAFSFHPVRIGAPVTCAAASSGSATRCTRSRRSGSTPSTATAASRSPATRSTIRARHGRCTRRASSRIARATRHLVAFPEHHSAILHEAGIPRSTPPTSALAALLDEEVKERLYLVHIAAKDVPAGRRPPRAPARASSTPSASSRRARPRFSEAIELLDIFAMVDFLRDLPLSRARSLLQVARRMTLPAGERDRAPGNARRQLLHHRRTAPCRS